MRKECRKCLFYAFDLGLKGKMGLDSVITLQEAFVFSCVFSFYFLLFEKKKKGKGNSEAKVLECTFAKTYILKTYEEN